jgi:hypothetical protein
MIKISKCEMSKPISGGSHSLLQAKELYSSRQSTWFNCFYGSTGGVRLIRSEFAIEGSNKASVCPYTYVVN